MFKSRTKPGGHQGGRGHHPRLRPHLRLRPEGARCRRALPAGGHRLHPGGGGVPGGAPPHGGGAAAAAGPGGRHENGRGGGDRPEPPPQQGLVDLDEGPGIDGHEQELKP